MLCTNLNTPQRTQIKMTTFFINWDINLFINRTKYKKGGKVKKNEKKWNNEHIYIYTFIYV